MTPWRSWLGWERFAFFFALFVGGALAIIALIASGAALMSLSFPRPEMADDYLFLAVSSIPAWFIVGTGLNTAGHVPVAIVWSLKTLFPKKD